MLQSVPATPQPRTARKTTLAVPQQVDELSEDVTKAMERIKEVVLQDQMDVNPITGLHTLVSQTRTSLYPFLTLSNQRHASLGDVSRESGDLRRTADGDAEDYMDRNLRQQPRGFFPTTSQRNMRRSRCQHPSFATGQEAEEIAIELTGGGTGRVRAAEFTSAPRHGTSGPATGMSASSVGGTPCVPLDSWEVWRTQRHNNNNNNASTGLHFLLCVGDPHSASSFSGVCLSSCHAEIRNKTCCGAARKGGLF
jgi:hypothetical protein